MGSNKNLLIFSSLIGRRLQVHAEVERQLRAAERAMGERDVPRLTELISVLRDSAFSIRERSCIQYYEAWLAINGGHYSTAVQHLSDVLDHGPGQYVARALASLSCIEAYRGDLDDALKLCSKAQGVASYQSANSLSAFLLRNEAVLLSLKGDHHSALEILKTLAPAVSEIARVQPAFKIDYYNSLATELQEVGELKGAHFFARLATSSPLAPRFPEWFETARGIALQMRSKSRSVIITPSDSRTRVQENTELELIAAPVDVEPPLEQPRAKILPFESFRQRLIDQRVLTPAALLVMMNFITAVSDSRLSMPVLRFIDRLIEHGATEDQIRRMTIQLNRKVGKRGTLKREEG